MHMSCLLHGDSNYTLEMQSVGENDIFKAGEQKPNAKGTLTRLGTPSQQLT